jgi:hypothetical protein
LPDVTTTPGLANPLETMATICAKTFHTRDERFVSDAMKAKVYASYGMARHKPPCPCEVDHLISLEIGGSNDEGNLWPQSYATQPWNAHVKDKLENHLHKLVCSGALDLTTAQHDIAANWIDAYRRYMIGQ